MGHPGPVGTRRAVVVLVMVAGLAWASCGAEDPAASPEPATEYHGTLSVLQSPDHGPELCTVMKASLPPQCGGLPVVGWDWDAVDGEEAQGGTTWGSWEVTGTYDGERFTLTRPPGAPVPPEPDPDQDFSPGCADPDVGDPAQGAAAWEDKSQYFEIPDVVAAWVSHPDGSWDGPFVGNIVVPPGRRQDALRRIREHYLGPVCVTERDGPTSAQLQSIQSELLDASSTKALGGIQTASTNERRGVVVTDVWVADGEALAYAKQRWGGLVELRGLLQPVD